MSNKTFIIAEAGVNHNGKLDLALKLIDAAAKAGADAVKFQAFKADLIVTSEAKQADYQTKNTGIKESQLDMIRKLELKADDYKKLVAHAKKRKIKFLCSPFDLESLKMLVSLKVDQLKLASGEVTNGPLLLKAAQTGLPIILSTGMANLKEIEDALALLAFGYKHKKQIPSTQPKFKKADLKYLRGKVSILHCTTDYPAKPEDINLLAIKTIADKFGLPTGYSDHTAGILASVSAVAMGARIIEKHFTLDKKLQGPDHKASLEPNELKQMVEQIREVEKMLGDGKKAPKKVELQYIKIVRRGLYKTAKGYVAMRPQNNLNPMNSWGLFR